MTNRNYILFRMKRAKTINHKEEYIVRRAGCWRERNERQKITWRKIKKKHESVYIFFILIRIVAGGGVGSIYNFFTRFGVIAMRFSPRLACLVTQNKKKNLEKVLESRFTQKLGVCTAKYIWKWLIWYDEKWRVCDLLRRKKKKKREPQQFC